MKILKLLNKKNLSIFIIYTLLTSGILRAEEEPVDIWDLEKKEENNLETSNSENSDLEDPTIEIKEVDSLNSSNIINSDFLDQNKINIAGLYDPADNELNIDMWSNSNGEEIKIIINKLKKIDLSNDAKNILDIALLTNSYFPKKNITEKEFIQLKLDYLIENNNKNLIKKYLIKNEENIHNSPLVKFYVNDYLETADLENACKIFDEKIYINDDYLNKFKVYCLIIKGNRDEAQLIFDLVKEQGLNDNFFENKFNFLMDYIDKADEKTSDINILNFHLSHRTNPNFKYQPNEKTPKYIWRYLSSSNLLENINTIDLEDSKKISLV